ncbi:MAG: DUF790 family protein [Myxococcales bacterium]|nr:DUF790 family protein [Myxococcales bacterium]
MLSADLVRARRSGDELRLQRLEGEGAARALQIAERYVQIAGAMLGRTRRELTAGLAAVPVAARDRKLADGLKKLVLDRCELETQTGGDPAALRAEVFGLASQRREAFEAREDFDRQALLEEIGARRGQSVEQLEALLYADLKDQHRLLSFEPLGGEALLALYRLAEEQAVLLRAERVIVEVHARHPETYRRLFRKLKFLRLLYVIEPLGPSAREAAGDGGARPEPAQPGYRITVEGPYSLFSSVTKYGLQLALLLPILRECDRYRLEAALRWGKERRPLRFASEGRREPGSTAEEPRLSDEVSSLLAKFEKRKSRWTARPCAELLTLPGVGLIAPDLTFEGSEGERIYLEVLGFWSRAAVWARVELVQAGLEQRILFAVPRRLRVSEAVMPEDLPAALYVFGGALSAKAVEERLDALSGR